MPLAKNRSKKYTHRDYLTWPDEGRWEIIDGIAYDMTPAPRVQHQNIVGNFYTLFKTNKQNPCYTGIAPTDVVFDEFNVVQPDVFLVCERTKITEANIQGAPELIIEVTSPGTILKDKREKKILYEKFGVKEYIIVYPELEIVERFFIEEGKYSSPDVFNWDETLPIKTLEVKVNLWDIFDKEPEKNKAAKPTARN